MTDAEKLGLLKNIYGDSENASVLDAYLSIAGEKVLNRLYPYDRTKTVADIPAKYHSLQVEIAVYLLNKRGAEGEIRHSENGIDRTYECADVPESMLKSIIPFCEVI